MSRLVVVFPKQSYGAGWLIIGCCLGNSDRDALSVPGCISLHVFPELVNNDTPQDKLKRSLRARRSLHALICSRSVLSSVSIVSDGEFRRGELDAEAGDALLILRWKGAYRLEESFP